MEPLEYDDRPMHGHECLTCRHLGEEVVQSKCAAFPNGIPEDILYNRVSHKKPHPEDNGKQYEPFLWLLDDKAKEND